MLKYEFEEKTGMAVTDAEYQDIKLVYMSDDNINQREFCNIWKNLAEPARDLMIKMARDKHRIKMDAQVAVQELLNEKKRILDAMFERTQVMGDPELRKECIKRMGARTYLTKMLEGDHKLWEADRQLMLEILQPKTQG